MMCDGCKEAADETANQRAHGNGMVPLHPCNDPVTCTCQHNRQAPVKPGEGRRT